MANNHGFLLSFKFNYEAKFNSKFNTFASKIKQPVSTISFNIESLGDFQILRRRGILRLSMRVKPDGSIHVTCPWFASEKEVIGFIYANEDWIVKHQKKVADRKVLFEIGQTINTRFHTIELVAIAEGTTRAVIKGTKVVVTIPASEETNSDNVQQFIRKVIVEICRKEAKTFLPERVGTLATQFGFTFEKVFVKNLKSKWGSCSSMGNINLNLHLMRLPDHLIDYIILHELAHTRQMNHGPKFWKLLNSITANKAQPLDKEMKNYSGFFF